MTRRSRFELCCVFAVLLAAPSAVAHPHHAADSKAKGAAAERAPEARPSQRVTGTSGQGEWRFRVAYTAEHLPPEAVSVLASAHGGFAIDRREGKGETYFALPGAGIIQISGDLKQTRMLQTPEQMKMVNLHNSTIWLDDGGTPYLTFPANDAGIVFTTTLDGELVHALPAPGSEDSFELPRVNDYFFGGGRFSPTDVEYLDGLLYITTGYSSLDFVLTARILSTRPFRAIWHDLAFGGRGSGRGQLGTGHGITIFPGTKRLDVSDRPNSEIDRFTRHGHYLSTLELPAGSFPCDVDYLEQYAVVGALHGPDRSRGAPIYVLENDRLISTILPKEELGLEKFQHIHNAVLHRVDGRFYIIAQAWNPGDFVILAQAGE